MDRPPCTSPQACVILCVHPCKSDCTAETPFPGAAELRVAGRLCSCGPPVIGELLPAGRATDERPSTDAGTTDVQAGGPKPAWAGPLQRMSKPMRRTASVVWLAALLLLGLGCSAAPVQQVRGGASRAAACLSPPRLAQGRAVNASPGRAAALATTGHACRRMHTMHLPTHTSRVRPTPRPAPLLAGCGLPGTAMAAGPGDGRSGTGCAAAAAHLG